MPLYDAQNVGSFNIRIKGENKMHITREQLIRKLAEKSNYYQRDIRLLLQTLDDVVIEYFDEVAVDEEVTVQVVQGVKIGCKVVPPRERVDPRDRSTIIVPDTVKPFARFSEDFRNTIQNQYDEKKDG